MNWKFGLFSIFLFLSFPFVDAWAWTPLEVDQDSSVRMPGTQPDQGVVLTGPGDTDNNGCINCHGENPFNAANETIVPGFFWQGSMMAQSARDPIFWAALTVANQDSIWALGNPNAADICLRCHFPEGWLGERSDPVNASAMTASDFDGVHCDFCHNLYDPFYETTFGPRESTDPGYWDEATVLSDNEAAITYSSDQTLAGDISLFSGLAFFSGDAPLYATYEENSGGQYFISDLTGHQNKRGPFADLGVVPDHSVMYSRYHKSKYFCATCHDVSNPVLANLGMSNLEDQSAGDDLIAEQYSASSYFHVERTFSEFILSAYGADGGAATNDEFQALSGSTITHVNKCQDCHMQDVTGKGADSANAPLRPTGAGTEHPDSGAPLHNMQGGNNWITRILSSTDVDSAIYDATNEGLLVGNDATLTLDMSQGLAPGMASVSDALIDGSLRANQQLTMAAAIQNAVYDPATGALTFRILNNTGHKLISGFPEGRRMWVNIQAFDDGAPIYEINPYDDAAGTLKGLGYGYSTDPGEVPLPAGLTATEEYEEKLVYEMHPSSTLTQENETFHFVLADGRYKDNRIPPKGFDIDSAPSRHVEPAWHGELSLDYYLAPEYEGGYDLVHSTLPTGADEVLITLYYQGTSREYVEFLRDEINGTGNLTLAGNGAGGDAPYLVQTDNFFEGLRGWGDTIWEIWKHNHGLDGLGAYVTGLAPKEMAAKSAVFALSSDSDSDFVADSLEIFNGTDPFNQDTDADGVIDGNDACGAGMPVKLDSEGRQYTTPQLAYSASSVSDTMLLQGIDMDTALVMNQEKTVVLQGKYACDFSARDQGLARLSGGLTVAAGTAIVDSVAF